MSDEDQASGSNRRRSQRWKVFEVAGVSGASGSTAGVIDDISATGALISTDLEFQQGEIVSFELEEFGSIPAQVVHVRDSLIGLSFQMSDDVAVKFRDWLESLEKEDR